MLNGPKSKWPPTGGAGQGKAQAFVDGQPLFERAESSGSAVRLKLGTAQTTSKKATRHDMCMPFPLNRFTDSPVSSSSPCNKDFAHGKAKAPPA
jgi:hypothetical protein